MSDLKHQSVDQLQSSLKECDEYIAKLKSNLNGQLERKKWIEHYIFEKTPQELTIEDIERKLGHKIIIVRY